MISALTSAKSGLTVGQIWQGDAACAKKELDRVLGKGKLELGLVGEEPKRMSHAREEKCLAVTLVTIHGVDVHELLD